MAEVSGTRQPQISAQAAFQREAVAIFRDVAERAGVILLNAADADGIIPFGQEDAIKARIGDMVQAIFSSGRAVFDENNRGVSPLAQALNRQIVFVTRDVLQAHQRYLQRTLPNDLWGELGGSQLVAEQGPGEEDDEPLVTPFEQRLLSNRAQSALSAERRALIEKWRHLRIFDPNPLAVYESAHEWVDPNGYRLSDRIWQAGLRTRQKVDALLAEAIREGRSAESIARRLEQFLVPGRAKVRTDKPYGTDASADAMRLARTEITRAHGEAARVAAVRNPYVEQMNFNLSHSHPRPDICDQLADGSPYPVDSAPIPGQDTHPHCLCYLTSLVAQSPAEVTEELRQAVSEAREVNWPPGMTPVQADQMLVELLGRELASLALQGVAA